MLQNIRIMMIEDSIEYREAIRLALEHARGIQLRSQFGTAEIAIRSLRSAKLRDLPDLILLDLRLPGMNGLDALLEIRKSMPEMKVIVLTQSDCQRDVLRAISLGAVGYLLKSSTVDEIASSIRTVIEGGASLDPKVAKLILKKMQGPIESAQVQHVLSQRETEILALLAEGLPKKEIAAKLGIGYKTVDSHVAHIYRKLDVSNAPSAVNRAHRLGLLQTDDSI
ncbi:Transcriptional regulatory protein LiaR [Rubripirellula tenax]|uniref:Transcriptional regulatory protein LiaR n=1 Tax=Rubripirellula tenax TaxID=2528015 RepID=A0A5C6ENE2_9BACT|nr:response regulator transcription factor [Rubripirellula tenax]TWU50612.1 Transcriptional regulatory protein LiaR [Rubripirellula tenax]